MKREITVTITGTRTIVYNGDMCDYGCDYFNSDQADRCLLFQKPLAQWKSMFYYFRCEECLKATKGGE